MQSPVSLPKNVAPRSRTLSTGVFVLFRDAMGSEAVASRGFAMPEYANLRTRSDIGEIIASRLLAGAKRIRPIASFFKKKCEQGATSRRECKRQLPYCDHCLRMQPLGTHRIQFAWTRRSRRAEV
ncbi:hypothetical protein Y032_0018g3601 [Ancylostoma ceylanicum]|uniref:Uncharacterized protein n=1 Tax=Ancylostoma ceylanicum TaxID=53326 RepID=A0A016V3S7_9BILA|nr:hypothetical protein Y032_0018g3601 [Ancylostoma ceylanicum]